MNGKVTAIVLIVLFSLIYLYLYQTGTIDSLFQIETLQSKLHSIGKWGPLFIIVLMAAAIVMSPLPSAPVALASGLVYGHGWGTIYILIGAEAGALIAFTLSRQLGYTAMQKHFGDKIKSKYLNSGKHLMLVVFITRLIPFISFDIISYAAGLTRISYLQFALATFAGILPASFLLAHLGTEMSGNTAEQMFITILFLGAITLIPGLIALYKKYKHKH